MSAALVESVREAVKLRALLFANSDVIGMGHEYYRLDLPAILAALAEAEALRAFRDDALKQVREWDAQRAEGQAREVELRKLAAYMAEDVCQCDENLGTQCASCFARDYLSAPTDTAALRAMLRAAWIDGIDGDDGSNSADAYIDRVLGGS